MKKISAQQRKDIERIHNELEKQIPELNNVIEAYNNAVADAYSELSIKLNDTNSTISDFKEVVGEIVIDIENYMDERSDAWRDSDNASLTEEWKDEFESIDIEEIEIEEPTPIEQQDISFWDDKFVAIPYERE